MTQPRGTVIGWGRVPRPGREIRSEAFAAETVGAPLSRGMGRSYGDSSLPPPGDPRVVSSALADRILDFDPETGLLRAEAGLTLLDLNRLFLPRRWFPPVTPGTQFVTLGGMVASDVHGKNHHVDGCIGDHLDSLRLRLASGEVVDIGPNREPELFWATVGGMGLTGHILEVALRLERVPTPWIHGSSERLVGIEALIDDLQRSSKNWPFTVGWLDCLTAPGRPVRGIILRGRWAEPGEAPATAAAPPPILSVPRLCPTSLLQPWFVRLFNASYYCRHWRRSCERLTSPWEFFYPLDVVSDWNVLYRHGFTQYQCVLPEPGARQAAIDFIGLVRQLQTPAYLVTMKDFGPAGRGLMSFPTRGISFSLDIPIQSRLAAMITAFDQFTLARGGRVYLTKEGFSQADVIQAMEGDRLDRFMQVRRRWDPDRRVRSAQSVRLFGDPE